MAGKERSTRRRTRRGRFYIGTSGYVTDVYVYFNNDVRGHAVANARDLGRYVLGG